jgi:hypothetical protein
VSPDPGFAEFYQIDSDPLIARISTVAELGVIATSSVINLAVYETRPIESKLDIYWETSTTGLISDLNTAIQLGSDESIASLSGWTFELLESSSPETMVSGDGFVFRDVLGVEITPDNVEIVSVFTLTGVNVTSKFTIDDTDSPIYKIKTAPGAYFYYGFNAVNAESYEFNIIASIGSPVVSENFIRTGNLTNVSPTIDEDPAIPNPIIKTTGEINVYQFNGVNGSNPAGGNSTADLTWSVTGNPIFTITSGGLLRNLSGSASGTYNLTVTLTDAGGATDSINIVVQYPLIQSFIIDGDTEICVVSPGGYVETFGTIEVSGNGWFARVYADANYDTEQGYVELELTPVPSGTTILVYESYDFGLLTGNSPVSIPSGSYSYRLGVQMINGGGCGRFEAYDE